MKILLIGNRILSEHELVSLLRENNLAARTLSCIDGDMAIELLKKIDIGLVMVHADAEKDLTDLTSLLQRFKREQPSTYVMLLLAPDDFSQISEELQEVVDDYLTLPIVGVELAIRTRKAGRNDLATKSPAAQAEDLPPVILENQQPLPPIKAFERPSAVSVQSADGSVPTEQESVDLGAVNPLGPLEQAESDKEVKGGSNPVRQAKSADSDPDDSLKDTVPASEQQTADVSYSLDPDQPNSSTPEPAEDPAKSDSGNSSNAPAEEPSEEWFSDLRAAFTGTVKSNGVFGRSRRFMIRAVQATVFGMVFLALGIFGVLLVQGKFSDGVPASSLSEEKNPSVSISNLRKWFADKGSVSTNTFQAGTVNIKTSEAMSKGGVNYYSPIQNLKPGNCLIKTITITNDRSESILLRAKITEAWTGTLNGSKDISTVSRDLSNIQWYIDNEPWPKADWLFKDGFWYYTGVLSPTGGGSGSLNDSINNGKTSADTTTFLTRVYVESPMTDSAYQGATYTINITFEAIPASADPELDLWNHDWTSAVALNWDNGESCTIADLMTRYNDRVFDPVDLAIIKEQQSNLQNNLM